MAFSLGCDSDKDGVTDQIDNCVYVPNPYQENYDQDSFGDACDNCGDVINDDQDNNDEDTLGDACDNCLDVTNEDQDDFDLDGMGDACDPCPDIPDPDCVPVTDPDLIATALLTLGPTECVMYTGDNPANEADPFMNMKFCGDGSLDKNWNPDPMAGRVFSLGTWSYGTGSAMTVDVTATAAVFGLDMRSVERYEAVFTYDGGDKLDLYGLIQDVPGDASSMVGDYSYHTEADVVIGPGTISIFVVVDAALTVNPDLTWERTTTTVQTGFQPSTTVEVDSGTLTNPDDIWLFEDVSPDVYLIQIDDHIVLTKNPCIDFDNDGYGDPVDASCPNAELDCHDHAPLVNPGAAEGPVGDPTCSDGVDNDCDGDTDAADPNCQ